MAVVIEVGPAAAHARAHALDVRFFRDHSEGAVAVVAIELRAAEVIGDEEIGQTIAVGVAPGAREAVAVVVDVQAGALGGLDEGSIAFVVEQAIGGPLRAS